MKYLKGMLHDHRVAYILLLPFIILYLTFSVFPIFFSGFLSFYAWNPVKGLSSMEFVGWENYYYALTDDVFWLSLWNTIKISFISGVSQHVLAISLAYILLHIITRGAEFFKAAIFLPYITSSVAVSLVVFNIFAPSGIVNEALRSIADTLRLEMLLPIDFFDVEWIRLTIANQVTWKYTGINTVIYMTGIASVSKELYEAIDIDGANKWQKFRYITLPLLVPYIFFATLMTIIGNMQMFEEPMMLTKGVGGVSNSGMTVSLYLYKMGWDWNDMGTASAIAWALFLITSLFSAIFFLLFGKRGIKKGGE
ncbi:sugar ABC transporter permease [Actinobacillus indolicus]|uniref:Sugar ABC transporter permease n=1 Tax=Actinobacillus indolicus TaxID=51049 RepID=A0A4P7CGZ0_9PAST|nr:sugar ABC transporter permease [Actinobacillus indolicus]QBQ64256.1 sugar ABC transporter permease [Actinobacillus indolicus]